MGLKRRNKVSAEFNMSSLTDIIFLLLIFFMLTSSIVAPNALNLKLPSSSRSSKPPSKITDVTIKKTGQYYVDGSRASTSVLESKMRQLSRKKSNPSITITPEKGVPVEYVVEVMDIAMRYHINAILAADPN